MTAPTIASTAIVEEGAQIGHETRVFHFCHIMSGARIGSGCTLGQGVHVASGAQIGDRVKVQNHVSVFCGVEVDDDVFLGPGALVTNVTNPRSEVSRRGHYLKTTIRRGATVGANATVVGGVAIGRYAFVAAGAVVTRDVADYVLVKGVPARPAGWMSRHGQKLEFDSEGLATCAGSGLRYKKHSDSSVRCVDLAEEEALPPHLALLNAGYQAGRL